MLLLNKSCRRSGLFRAAAAGRLVHYRSSPLSACRRKRTETPGPGSPKVFPPEETGPARAGRRGSLPSHLDTMTKNPGFMFLICPDSHFLHARLENLLAGSSAERHIYWGDEEPPPRFWEDLTLQGLFGKPRVLVARQANLWPAAVWKKISAALGHPSEQCRPFFCLETAWEKGQPKLPAHIKKLRCLTFAEQQGWIWKNEGLTERTLRRHVQERARALRVPFEEDAFEQFCASVPADANAVENELCKLRLMLDAEEERKPPEPPRVTAALLGGTGWSPESNVFACIRHMEAGNLSAVWKELGRSRHDPEGLFFPLLSLLARDVRLLWQCRMGENVRMHPSEAAFKQQLSARLGAAGLAELMSMIMDAEWQVKSGRRSVEQSLDMLAADVTDLCARAR